MFIGAFAIIKRCSFFAPSCLAEISWINYEAVKIEGLACLFRRLSHYMHILFSQKNSGCLLWLPECWETAQACACMNSLIAYTILSGICGWQMERKWLEKVDGCCTTSWHSWKRCPQLCFPWDMCAWCYGRIFCETLILMSSEVMMLPCSRKWMLVFSFEEYRWFSNFCPPK